MSKLVLITGGSRGIGAETARLAAASGFDVAISYLNNASAAQEVCNAVRGYGQAAFAVQADMRKSEDIDRLYSDIDKIGPLYAVVNNAGISLSSSVDAVNSDKLIELMQVNLISVILSSSNAVRRMSTRFGGTGGVIINLSSMAATIGGKSGSTMYAASKAAVDSFTTGLAKEVGSEGIRVNAIRPGATLTDLVAERITDPTWKDHTVGAIPFGRLATVTDIATPIVWLLSDAAAYISGAHINVSGGGYLI